MTLVGSRTLLSAAMFQVWQADVLVRYTTRELSVLTQEA